MSRPYNRMLLILLIGLVAGTLAAGLRTDVAAQPTAQPPAFTQQQLDEADALIKDVFRDELTQAKTNKDARRDLAQTLLEQSKRIQDESHVRFVALSLARDLAAQAGDHGTAFAAIAELAKHHKFDETEAQAKALATVIENTTDPGAARTLADLALKTANQFAQDNEIELAVRHAQLAEAAAKKGNDSKQLQAISGRAAELAVAYKETERIAPLLQQLKKNPNDPQANLEVGKSWCFARDNWEKGLPYLAKGADVILKEVAAKDLANPIKGDAQAAVAEAWWDAAQQKSGDMKQQMLRRSYQWYLRAVYQLDGAGRAAAQARLKELMQILPAKLRVTEIEVELKRFTEHTGEVLAVAFSPGGLQAASCGIDKSVRLWDVISGKPLHAFTGHGSAVLGIVFARDGKHLFSCGEDKTVRKWDATTGKEVQQLQGHADIINGLAVSPDGRWLAGAGQDRNVYVWDLTGGNKVRQLAGHGGPIYRVVFSPTGQQLASASEDQTVRLWDVATGQVAKEFRGHSGPVIGLGFSPDGKRIVSGGGDNYLRLWDTDTGKEVHRFTGHTAIVGAAAFSPDGTRLVSASDDRTVRLWDIETGQLIRTLHGHTDAVYGAAFSLDGRWVISCSLDRTVRLWGERK